MPLTRMGALWGLALALVGQCPHALWAKPLAAPAGASSSYAAPYSPFDQLRQPPRSVAAAPLSNTIGACDCAYDLICGSKVNCEFQKKVTQIATELWPADARAMANNLMAVFAWESGNTFRADTPNRSNSGATGFIQLLPDTYRALTGQEPIMETVTNYWHDGQSHLRIQQVAQLRNTEYLGLVRRYLQPLRRKKLEFVDLYLHVLFPASSGKPDHVVFTQHPEHLPFPNEQPSVKAKRLEVYPRQAGLDLNQDGDILKSEIAEKVSHYVSDGEPYRSKCAPLAR